MTASVLTVLEGRKQLLCKYKSQSSDDWVTICFNSHWNRERLSMRRVFHLSNLTREFSLQVMWKVWTHRTVNSQDLKPFFLFPSSSDQYARLYDLRRPAGGSLLQEDDPLATFCPPHLESNERSVHITCVAISQQEEVLVSYNDELVYLFQPNQSREARARTSAEAPTIRTPVTGKIGVIPVVGCLLCVCRSYVYHFA